MKGSTRKVIRETIRKSPVPKPIDAVSAIEKLETNKMLQMKRHNNVECTNWKQLESNWTEEVKFIKTITVTKTNSSTTYQNSRTRRTDTSEELTQWMNLTSLEIWSIHSAPYCTRWYAPEFERDEIDKTMKLNMIETAQRRWEAAIVFAP